jgi:hypothetical protein
MITVRLTTQTTPALVVRNVIEYYDNEILSSVEVLAENKYDEVRNYQLAELFEYFKGELTTQQYVSLINSVRNHVDDWRVGSPRLRLWFENGQDSAWSTNFTANGYAQTTYYSVTRKDKALEILQFIS